LSLCRTNLEDKKGKTMRRTTLTSSLCLILLLGATSLVAQAEPEGTYFETIHVQTVHIPVVVTDRDGLRVSGLEQDDFELLVNGEPTVIFTMWRPIRTSGRAISLAPTS
jgi:hypothetical protein